MLITLNFIKGDNGKYLASHKMSGYSTVQISRRQSGMLRIFAYLEDMEPVVIGKYGSDSPKDLLFELSLQKGVEIVLISDTEVMESKILYKDAE